ncbi:hypothetical protein L3Q82_023657, partial [Scortum barcoo]
MKQNKQSAPYWRVSLANLCRMVGSLRQEAWSGEEEEEGELREGSLQLLEELYSLQHICRALQSREERVPGRHVRSPSVWFWMTLKDRRLRGVGMTVTKRSRSLKWCRHYEP